eukprot:COSAG02_NODE_6927_length_3284_cov_1.104553_3_plen_261_part_00
MTIWRGLGAGLGAQPAQPGAEWCLSNPFASWSVRQQPCSQQCASRRGCRGALTRRVRCRSVQHIATSKGAPRNLFNFWTGEAPRPAASGGREASQLVGSVGRRTAYANLTVGCETYWTAVADSQLLGVEPPMQLTRYWNNNGRGYLERTKAVMFAGVGGILRPERAAQLQDLRYRLQVLHEAGKKMELPLLTCSVEETVQGLGAWLKGWNPCGSKWKPGLKRVSSIMASPAAPTAQEEDEKRTRVRHELVLHVGEASINC